MYGARGANVGVSKFLPLVHRLSESSVGSWEFFSSPSSPMKIYLKLPGASLSVTPTDYKKISTTGLEWLSQTQRSYHSLGMLGDDITVKVKGVPRLLPLASWDWFQSPCDPFKDQL
ncbi:unnamed protein product [Pleuronectes platessa]|uniref:Uncharacterized protein n=1 Tax=Pleuronectes platessa TaxID=8262 RepID=A0A9N7UZW1_PLEPL|nr:unnamed protein product [Pleuronectes platessa]